MPSNQAAWLSTAKQNPLQIHESPFPKPSPSEVLLRNAYIAINPMDYKIQDYNPPIGGRPLTYPLILGSDVAGTIMEVGEDVENRQGLQVGAKVIAHVSGGVTGKFENSGFQHYLTVPAKSLIAIPEGVNLENAVVLPLACDTAAAGLFMGDRLNLSVHSLVHGPKNDKAQPQDEKQVLLIWGGSSSVGCCAIQMAVAAGYDVFTVASARNHALCKSAGAVQVFDQSRASIEDDIVSAATGRVIAGALDCISDAEKTTRVCAEILVKANALNKKVVVVLNVKASGMPQGIVVERVNIPSYFADPAYAQVHAWMERGIVQGTLQPMPDPLVFGTGLESIQAGIDRLRQGVSAKKVVIRVQQEV